MLPRWPAFLKSSNSLLKVLNGVGSNNKKLPLPSQVFEMFHLTHLAFIGSFRIPSAISNLANLQTLIIHPTFHRQRKRNWRDYEKSSHFSLPKEIWKMMQLRHIILYDCYMLPHLPDGSNLPLQNLQTLSTVRIFLWNAKSLQMIPNIKKLGLVYNVYTEHYLRLLENLHQLENLKVTGYGGFSWRGQIPSFLRTLQKLTLMGGKYPWKDMGIIVSLPNLQLLKLLDHACDGETWEIADENFPQLQVFLIDTSRLSQWTIQSTSFPILRFLVLRSCWYLSEIPESIGEIPTLERLEVYSCGRSLVESAYQIKDYQHSYGNDALQVRVVHSDKGEGVDLLSVSKSYHVGDSTGDLQREIDRLDKRIASQQQHLQELIAARDALQRTPSAQQGGESSGRGGGS